MGFSSKDIEHMQERVAANAKGVQRPESTLMDVVLYPELPELKPFGVVHINPIGAPRMTRSDQWRVDPDHPDPAKRQRPCVTRYYAWKDAFVKGCAAIGWKLDERVRVEFRIAMPQSWSKKKKAEMLGKLHQQKPDHDNCAKAVGDAFGIDDGFIADGRYTKRWAEAGCIILYK